MKRPPRDPKEPVLERRHWIAISVWAALITASVLGALFVAQEVLGRAPREAVTVSFLALALAQVWHVFDMRASRSHPIANDVVRNPWVWGAIGLCMALLVGAVHLPGLSDLLDTANPGWSGWAVALAASLVPTLLGQIWIQAAPRRLAPEPDEEDAAEGSGPT